MLKQFAPFEHLYTQDREKVIAEFQSANKHLSDVEGEIEHYERIEEEIQLLPNTLTVSQAVLLSTGVYCNGNVHVYCTIYKLVHVHVHMIITCTCIFFCLKSL